MGVVSGRLAEAAAAVVKKALPIAGEGLAQTLTLLPGLLLTSVNADADPAKDRDWQMYMRNHAHPAIPPPPKSDELRLAELERAQTTQTLTEQEEAELITLLAKVKGIHVQRLEELNRSNKANSYRKGPAKKTTSNNPGRTGKQTRLRELAKDDKLVV